MRRAEPVCTAIGFSAVGIAYSREPLPIGICHSVSYTNCFSMSSCNDAGYCEKQCFIASARGKRRRPVGWTVCLAP